MSKPKSTCNPLRKRDDAACDKRSDFIAKPTLYSSIIQTEFKLRNISRSRLEPKSIANNAPIKEVNFPMAKQVYDYSNMVDVGLNSGIKTKPKPKPREISIKKPEPKLSDYYQPSFDNVQQIQMNCVETMPELTVQYDGLSVSRLLNEIDDLVFH